jgi:hypothetical protein
MDAETLSVVGRNRLIEQLLQGGVDVAVPLRDNGIDLIAYNDSRDGFVVCPIQVKASAGRSFSIDQKLEKIPNLIHAFVWGVGTEHTGVFALTHHEALGVADAMGYTLTQAWQRGLYTTQQPSKSLVEHLERFRMTPEDWKKKISGMV